jgi:hypothetical protein
VAEDRFPYIPPGFEGRPADLARAQAWADGIIAQLPPFTPEEIAELGRFAAMLDARRARRDSRRDVGAATVGGFEFTPVDGPVPDNPPLGASHVVIRTVSVPFDVDEHARQVAAERGVDVEVVLAEWVESGSR